MKIVKLTVENYMGIKAAEITPTGNVVLITGANGQGKTSVLNAIWAALIGGDASRAIKQQVRDGEKQASVRLDLGEYIVTRRWYKDGVGTLTVETPRGAEYQKPQTILDGLVAKLAMDPLGFLKLDGPKQVATLIDMLGDSLSFDPAELERRRLAADTNRAAANRDVKTLKARLDAAPEFPTDTPIEEVSVSDVLAEHEAAREHNASIQRAEDIAAELGRAVTAADSNIAELKSKLLAAETDRIEKFDRRDSYLAIVASKEPIDTNAITTRLTTLEATNATIRDNKARLRLEYDWVEAEQSAKRYDDELTAIKKEKADGIAAADLPNPALSFDDDGVLYNGIPLAQASGKERRMVGLDLARKMNPELRVIRVDEGESLDTAAMAEITAWAEEHDYQVWVTAVREGDKNSIVIQDGMVAE